LRNRLDFNDYFTFVNYESASGGPLDRRRAMPIFPGDSACFTGGVTSQNASSCRFISVPFRTIPAQVPGVTRPVALVTGAGRRVGRAIVTDLARHGFDVAVHFHGSRAEAAEVASCVESLGARATLIESDLSGLDAAERLVSLASAALGPIDLLVNNASVFLDDGLADFEWAQFDQHFAIHVKAPLELVRRFAAALPAGRQGLVVNIIDQRVWKPTPRYFSYSLSKATLWAATRTMAQALAPRVRVNAIGPGPTLPSPRQSQADFDRQRSSVLLGRGPDLDAFGRTIRYLWEEKSITGQMIAIDGGQHLAWETPDVDGVAE